MSGARAGEERQQRSAFGRYQVLASLGEGGMARVFLAVSHVAAGAAKLVVVKELKSELASDPEARRMFLDEARLAMRLSHPNVVQTFDADEDEACLYLAMEFLDGQPLNRVLHDGRFTMPLDVKLRVAALALDGLHYAHELKDFDGTPLAVVHRDVSPHNIFLTYDGHVKLVDFGIAKCANLTASTQSGIFKGKVRYASSEQVLCLAVDRRADIFAMGVLLWELTAGTRMWRDLGDTAVILELANGRVPSLRDAAPEAPAELISVVDKALAPEASGRFATAADLRDALLGVVDRISGRAPSSWLAKAMGSGYLVEREAQQARIHEVMKGITSGQSLRLTRDRVPSKPGEPASSSGSFAKLAISGRASAVAPSSLGTTGTVRSVGVRNAPSRTVALAAAGIGLVGLMGLALVRSKDREAAALVASPAPRSASPPAAEASAQGAEALVPDKAPMVAITVTVDPPSAELLLDGKVVGKGSSRLEVPRDAAKHRLRARAPLHEPKEVSLSLGTDAHVALTLPPASAPAPAARAQRKAVAPAAAPPGTAPLPDVAAAAAPGPAQGAIDDKNPYAR